MSDPIATPFDLSIDNLVLLNHLPEDIRKELERLRERQADFRAGSEAQNNKDNKVGPEQEIINIVRQCIVSGEVILHSGQKSDWVCDLNFRQSSLSYLAKKMDMTTFAIGIEFLGAMMVKLEKGVLGGYVRKDGSVYGPNTGRQVTLVDDVVTTEASFIGAEKAITEAGYTVIRRCVILDRRKEKDKTLDILSLVTAEDIGREA